MLNPDARKLISRMEATIDQLQAELRQLKVAVVSRPQPRNDPHKGIVFAAVLKEGGKVPYERWYAIGATQKYSRRGLGGLFPWYVQYVDGGANVELTELGRRVAIEHLQDSQA